MSDRLRPQQFITAALVHAHRHVNEFTIGRNCVHGIYPETTRKSSAMRSGPLGLDVAGSNAPRISAGIFQINDPMKPSALSLDSATFSEPQRLHLRIASCDEGSTLDCCDNIVGLQKLLRSMHVLRRPDLELSYTTEHHPILYRYDELVLPYLIADYPSLYNHYQISQQVTTYDNLEESNFASSATNLLCVLLVQMPNLKHVKPGPTRLLEGCWEGVIECLKRFNHFTTFQYHGRPILECDNGDIDEYIMHGGRHPCLSDDQPTYASQHTCVKSILHCDGLSRHSRPDLSSQYNILPCRLISSTKYRPESISVTTSRIYAKTKSAMY